MGWENFLKSGQLYRVDANKGDVVLGYSNDSFVPLWNNHQGSLQEALEKLNDHIESIRNMGIVLFCGTEKGFTKGNGNGTYYRFLYGEKVIYLSLKQIDCYYFVEP